MRSLWSLNGLGDDVLFVPEDFQPSTTSSQDQPVKKEAAGWIMLFRYVLNVMLRYIVKEPMDGNKN